ncbi:MAG: VanZ family protein [Phycisphaerales bacterium]
MTPRARTAIRAVFALATLTLLTATHWPGIKIDGPMPRPDMWVHAITYAVWTGLLLATGLVGSPASPRAAVLAVIVGVAFGAFDESTQPLFHRTADITDLLADTIGAMLGSGTIWAIARRHAASTTARERPVPD